MKTHLVEMELVDVSTYFNGSRMYVFGKLYCSTFELDYEEYYGPKTILLSAKIRLAVSPSGKFPLPSRSSSFPIFDAAFSTIYLIQKQRGAHGCQGNSIPS